MFSILLQAEDGIRVGHVTGVQTCALPISMGTFKIHLRVVVIGEVLIIEVTDNGPGFPPGGIGDAMRNGTGLRNVKERIDRKSVVWERVWMEAKEVRV